MGSATHFFAALIFVVLALAMTARAAHAQAIAESIQPGVVAISNGKGSNGFGIVVAERDKLLTIVTANHVVRDNNQLLGPILVKFFGVPDAQTAVVLSESLDDHDVAVIQVPAPPNFSWRRDIVTKSMDLRRGERLWIVGRPVLDWTIPAVPGAFQKRDVEGFLHAERLGVLAGNSGGPLVSDKGLVGLLTHTKNDLDTIAVPIELIANAFSSDNWNLPWDVGNVQTRKVFSKFSECKGCPDMVVLPSGNFMMGSDKAVNWPDPTSQPKHNVKISYELAVGETEVTGPQWLLCVKEGGCVAELGYTIDPYTRLPVEFVNLKNAHDYVAWISKKTGATYRLLTEAEWEYAARGGSEDTFPWGETMHNVPAVCWGCGGDYDGSKTKAAAPVGRFPPNKFHLKDMAGNVAELVEDCWADNYADAPTDGKALIVDGCSYRIARGGSYLDPPLSLRVFARAQFYGEDSSQGVGFRVARDISD